MNPLQRPIIDGGFLARLVKQLLDRYEPRAVFLRNSQRHLAALLCLQKAFRIALLHNALSGEQKRLHYHQLKIRQILKNVAYQHVKYLFVATEIFFTIKPRIVVRSYHNAHEIGAQMNYVLVHACINVANSVSGDSAVQKLKFSGIIQLKPRFDKQGVALTDVGVIGA